MESLIIREYQEEDKDNLLSILKLNIPHFFAEEELNDFKIYLEQKIEYYFVVEYKGKIVGSGGINLEHDSKIAKISWDFINPQYHGLGIGRKLLEYRIDIIRVMHKDYKIIVRTSQYVYQFYEKNSFVLESIIKDYWSQGFDLYLMEYKF
ncbi:GNAT family N-acetyltransferase [Riemerella anatipestifer]|uniref:GNAT family N-acetyltransferase n=1 Tax=Riemerella anatipestifer TaxID=34085 RepID=UPI000D6865C1|nr:GNAT family N-acetyltransferase [Riemerella anatipestifer]MBT0551109.1 GNAT family N-acetyltransferase [Riemerella anatipestifer]MBT0553724.1 GNAT family N-acetyltransferase [Riemerella anatipestifer]MCE3023932.1 GNAT family N-acetyltransferase [Riemerella anatipestifer]MCU7542309.1 GNAT family N-acetyltransferase [Riemerella anatipestifer]MCU7559706.1 GNAT family N-acetyltransferase [Riemerella anatipestifer]